MSTKKTDLLKEAIAEAKAIRGVALENAKQTLLEAFTPKLQSMFTARMREEEEEVPTEEVPTEEVPDEEAPVAPAPEAPVDEVPTEEVPTEEVPTEEGMDNYEDDEDLDLESIIRELEGEVTDEVPAEEAPMDPAPEEDMELESIIRELQTNLTETETEDEPSDPMDESAELKRQLGEAKQIINVLRNQLTEVNMINAKLLYVTRIFKAGKNLSENQKTKIIETFDRAKNVREVKLIYSTLAESISNSSAPKVKQVTRKTRVTEAQASAPIKKTENPKPIIENAYADRFRELAFGKGKKTLINK